MKATKRILIVFPHNLLQRDNGVNKRYFGLVEWLKQKGFGIDLLGLRNFDSSWKDFKRENAGGMIRRLYLYDFRVGHRLQRLSAMARKITGAGRGPDHSLPDYAFRGMAKLFRKILSENPYDYVMIGYVYWANLVKEPLPAGIVKVLTVEDLISVKIHEHAREPGDAGQTIAEEMRRVALFDRVICLSHEEMAFFSSRVPSPRYFYVPVFMDAPVLREQQKECDLMFIGYDNADNREGIGWFFRDVHPLLPQSVTLTVVGRVARYVPDLPGVTRQEQVADPGTIYAKCRLSINPLRKGTGMKVKVVESLAHGVPVVSTTRGLCGFAPELVTRFAVADDPRGFAEAVIRLLADKAGYEARCREARRLFEENFETGVAGKALSALFDPPPKEEQDHLWNR